MTNSVPSTPSLLMWCGVSVVVHNYTSAKRCRYAPLSRICFASLTLVARYGLPPLSGWLRSISVRWAFWIFSLVRELSLGACKSVICVGDRQLPRNTAAVPEGEDQRGLFLGHFCLETALVEGLSHGSYAAPGPSPGDQAGPTLMKSSQYRLRDRSPRCRRRRCTGGGSSRVRRRTARPAGVHGVTRSCVPGRPPRQHHLR